MLQQLVDAGNSVVVIEHNLDVIKVSDRLIDLGPEGGDEGGQVIATGTPEEVAAEPRSHTGQFLAAILPVRAKRGRAAASRNGGKTSADKPDGSRAAAAKPPANGNGAKTAGAKISGAKTAGRKAAGNGAKAPATGATTRRRTASSTR